MKCRNLILLLILITYTTQTPRRLFNITIYNNDCVNLNYTNIFTDYFNTITDQVTNIISYTNNLTIWDSNNSSKIIIDYIKTEDTNKISEYALTSLIQFAIFVLFAVIMMIGWLVSFICCIRPRCCCARKEKDIFCKKFSYYVVLVTSIISIIMSIVSITLIM